MKKTARFILPLLCGMVLLSCNHSLPNVVLIMADDLGAECLRSYGGNAYDTPHLDRLAEEGMLVSHCIAQPLCTPSRVKLMTGLYNDRNYEHFGYLDTCWFTMGEAMKQAGYRTCIAGKWQLNGLAYKEIIGDWNDAERPHRFGFDEYCLWQLTRQRGEGERYADPLIEQNGKVLDLEPGSYGPDVFCNYLLDFIDRNRNRPFFAYYPMVLVHEPFVPTPDSEEWSDPSMRYHRDTAHFRDMMSYMDKIVGRIVGRLEQNGIRDNTLLIFTADNGTDRMILSATKDRMVQGGKGTTTMDGTHVPLIISWPERIRKPKVYQGLIEFSDFFPTLAEIAGQEVVTDGISFRPLLEGRKHKGRSTARVYYDPRWGEFVNRYRNCFVQTEDYKLYQDGTFYNIREDVLEQDPLQPENLDPSAARAHEMLRRELYELPADPPNLVLIITDDQGYGDLGLHGNRILETPSLDALGLQGVRLDRFHVSPVCAPTRAALLTGRRPMSTGTYYVTRGAETMDAEEYTLAEILRDNGYSTGCFGKWHNGAHHPHHPLSQGFDEFLGFTAGHWNRYFDPELEYNGRMVPTRGYIADVLTDSAIAFIRRNREAPYFCYLSYNTPHSPFQVPDAYFNKYINRVEEEDPALRIMNASVYGMVENIDDNVGRVMESLVELGLEENTIVVFLTDNGPNTERFNGNMKGRKGWVNDGGVRVPCFIRWKGHVPENKIISSTTAHIDLLPTLVTMMDLRFEPVREIHGVDLTSRIFGVDREGERSLFTHVNHGLPVSEAPGAVRTPGWRFTFTRSDRPELTARDDTGERQNLADSLPGLADSLMGAYMEWFRPYHDLQIPVIPVGAIDSVVIPAHEGFLEGKARYRWSDQGWANDWVTGLDTTGSSIRWNLDVKTAGAYRCFLRYTSRDETATILMDLAGRKIRKGLPPYTPVQDRNYSRIDRPAEAIGQSWNRILLERVVLEKGLDTLTIRASSPGLELLSVTLLKSEK